MSKLINRFSASLLGLVLFDFSYPRLKKSLVDSQEDQSNDIQRVKLPALQNLHQIFQEIKFKFYNIKGVKWTGLLFGSKYDDYWIDGAGYKISQDKFKEIVETTHQVHNMCLEATDFAIQDDEILQKLFDIPLDMIPMIRESWKQRQPDLLSRYDFLIGEKGEIYFLEVNGDTPSGIIEAGPAQKIWAQKHNLIQFNTLEQNITEGFKKILDKNKKKKLLMFKNDNFEDTCTFEYLQSLVQPITGVHNFVFKIEDMDNQLDCYDSTSSMLWRQYPLEWLASETPRYYFKNPNFYELKSQTMIEPPWKIIMSNKAMSVLLNTMYPNNPHLIQSSLAPLDENIPQLAKQKYAREGQDIFSSNDFTSFRKFLLHSYYKHVHQPIFQKFMGSDLHQNRYLTVSSWIVHGSPCGILLREDLSHIIGTGSSVVPYFISKKEGDNNTIQVELKNTIESSKLRTSLYGNSSNKHNTNDIMINIKERTDFILNDKLATQQIKEKLIQEFENSKQKSQEIFNLPIYFHDLFAQKSPILVGFSPLFSNLTAGTLGKQSVNNENNINSPQNNGHHGNGGGGSGGEGGYTRNFKPNQSPPSAGTTGKMFSSHS